MSAGEASREILPRRSVAFRAGARRLRAAEHAALDLLARGGRPASDLAARLDLMSSIGPRYALHEHRRRSAGAAEDDGRRTGYFDRWSEAARTVGAVAEDLSRGFIRIADEQREVVVWNHCVPLDDIVTVKLALEKPLVHRLLTHAGLPIPEHVTFHVDDVAPALTFLARHRACVVKPVDREGGSVTTSGIRSTRHLQRACLRARRLSTRLMIEREIPGENYRMLFLDGELLDVVCRESPRVFGDGRSTVRELFVAENDRRYALARGEPPTWELVADLDAVLTLERQGLTMSSVPAAGEPVIVKRVVNANGAEFNVSVRDDVPDDLVEEARRSVDLLGVRLAGVDVITPDRRRSLSVAGGAILEINATPGLHYHYETRNPERAVAVLVPVLRALLAAAERSPAAPARRQPDKPATAAGRESRTPRSEGW
jgi:D-alanine-D-alanine ligase-like ATP-grasp enzyme